MTAPGCVSPLHSRFLSIEESLQSLQETFSQMYQNHVAERISQYKGHHSVMVAKRTHTPFTPLLFQNPHIILFYKYFQIPSHELHQKRHDLEWKCRELGLEGKLRLAGEGINGTMAGEKDDLQTFVQYLHQLFAEHFTRARHVKGALSAADSFTAQPVSSRLVPTSKVLHYQDESIDVKWYRGKEKENFPGLVVRVVKELCTLGISQKWTPQEAQGVHLDPHTFHQMVKEKLETGDDSTVLIDCRNEYEWQVGRIPEALCPPTRRFSDFPQFIDKNVEKLKQKRILMYCTGGIRCERGSAYLKSKGIDEVYQLAGGIFRYVEALQSDTLFEGKNFVFDNIGYLQATPNKSVTHCCACHNICDNEHRFCSTAGCKVLLVCCNNCFENQGFLAYCCDECRKYGCAWEKKLRLMKHDEKLHKKTKHLVVR
uniref:Rhodanese domain-containing protein n=1 Tax=Percolomonas cosmopolitus TaxID=63605 RepID=A0A6U0KJR4_9EUKA|mmetsp:Transcript_2609/g.9962  ORF Transcript_2609/g.9962 Transcript_2609/m.9962 type:complete len:427 (+) Transcript_2609:1239-2519(+)